MRILPKNDYSDIVTEYDVTFRQFLEDMSAMSEFYDIEEALERLKEYYKERYERNK